MGRDHLAVKDFRRFVPMLAGIVVALGKVGEHQPPHAALGCDVCGLTRGQMPVAGCQLGVSVEESGLDHQQVSILGQCECGVAQPGVHNEGEALPPPDLTDILQTYPLTGRAHLAGPLQLTDGRSGDTKTGQQLGHHATAVGLDEAVAEGVNRMIELTRLQKTESPVCDRAVCGYRVFVNLKCVVENTRVSESGEVLPA